MENYSDNTIQQNNDNIRTKGRNGIIWSSLALFIFMVINVSLSVRLSLINGLLGSIVGEMVLIPIALLFFLIMKSTSKEERLFGDMFSFKRAGLVNCIIAVSSAIFFIPGIYLLTIINDLLLQLMTGGRYLLSDSTSSIVDMGLLGALLCVAVLPALCEEFLFRGFIKGATDRYPLAAIMLLNGLFFALAHCSEARILDTFFIGMVYAYVTVKTGSIVPSMIMHFVNNAFSVGSVYLYKYLYESGFFNNAIGGVEGADLEAQMVVNEITLILIIGVVGIVTMLISLYFISLMTDYNKRKRAKNNLPPLVDYAVTKGKIPAAVQLLALIPALIVFAAIVMLTLATFGIIDCPVIIELFRGIWGV